MFNFQVLVNNWQKWISFKFVFIKTIFNFSAENIMMKDNIKTYLKHCDLGSMKNFMRYDNVAKSYTYCFQNVFLLL